jgi:hypothetical protein
MAVPFNNEPKAVREGAPSFGGPPSPVPHLLSPTGGRGTGEGGALKKTKVFWTTKFIGRNGRKLKRKVYTFFFQIL